MERFCQNCNRPNPAEAAFCRHCASPMAQIGGQPRVNQVDPNQGQYGNQPQWNQPNFGAPMQQNAAQSSSGQSQKAIAAFGLAIAGLVCCGPFTGIPAAVVGWMEMTAIKEGRSAPGGMWMAQVGLWGGIAVSILHTIIGFLWILLTMMASPGY